MSTPTNRQAEKERKPGAKQNQSSAKGQDSAIKRVPTTPQPGDAAAARRDERLEQRRAEIQARQQERRRELQQATTSPAPRPASQPAARVTTPPAPKPRDPSVARRDERREERRAEIQARQQERRRELQQAKRQKIGIRYSFVVAAVLLVALVSFFNFAEHSVIFSLIAAGVVVIAEFAFLAITTLTTPKKAGYRPRSSSIPARSDTAGEHAQEASEVPQDASEDAPAQETAEQNS